MIHYCCRCGKPCDCWAFDQSQGDVCDGCSDCDESLSGSEGQDRESYSDTQDRKSYTVDPDWEQE